MDDAAAVFLVAFIEPGGQGLAPVLCLGSSIVHLADFRYGAVGGFPVQADTFEGGNGGGRVGSENERVKGKNQTY